MGGNDPRARRILIAEDIPSIAELMRRILHGAGFEADTAEDGLQCLEKVSSFRPDLVIMDIMMPKVHGLDALKRIKADPESRSVGVIVCTAKSYKPDEEQALMDGAFSIIPKPFKPDELLGAVRAYFEGAPSAGSGKGDAGQSAGKKPETEPYAPRPRDSEAKIRLWGTRGSIPVAGSRYVRYGGNTSCMSIERGDDSVIIDAGSGIRDLGFELAKRGPRRLHLFIGHTHWDHIQGFPFFVPAYIPGFEIIIYGASGFGKDLESIFRGQLDRDYFPVQLSDMRARLEFRHLDENPVSVGDMRVHWEFTQHPGATLAFKIETGGRRVTYLTDNEFLMGYRGSPAEAESNAELMAPYRKIVDFVTGSDILFGEAQYTTEEYAYKIGWGHSSIANACLLAKAAGVQDWVVVHHDPAHDDIFVDEQLNLIKRVADEIGHHGQIRSGYDGMVEYLD